MIVLSFIACKLNHHEPLRREVRWDGEGYVGVCRHCEAPIERYRRRRWGKRHSTDAKQGEPTPT
jgi:hypothetical protein